MKCCWDTWTLWRGFSVEGKWRATQRMAHRCNLRVGPGNHRRLKEVMSHKTRGKKLVIWSLEVWDWYHDPEDAKANVNNNAGYIIQTTSFEYIYIYNSFKAITTALYWLKPSYCGRFPSAIGHTCGGPSWSHVMFWQTCRGRWCFLLFSNRLPPLIQESLQQSLMAAHAC